MCNRRVAESTSIDSDLEHLLQIKNSVESLTKRVDALSSDEIIDEVEARPSHKVEPATYAEFLSREELEEINRAYQEALHKGAECDALDYALSAMVGVVCGVIDFLFTSTPHVGPVSDGVDDLFDKMVTCFASKTKNINGNSWNPKPGNEDNVASAIGFLERTFAIGYDQAKSADVLGAVKGMSTVNHHAKSLAHQPDLIGLVASICCQFTDTSTFFDKSKGSIVIVAGTGNGIKLKGDTLIAKIFCGAANWLGHCISDIAGSSGTRGKGDGHAGAGLPIPFTEFLQFCDFGKLANEKGQWQSFATVVTEVYEQGYDARHGATMSIPVIMNELLIRVVFVLKRRFYDKLGWYECLPVGMNYSLQRMLTVGIGSMCTIDLAGATLKSGGNWVGLLTGLSTTAWARFGLQGVQELRLLANKETSNILAIEKEIDSEWEDLKRRSGDLNRRCSRQTY